MKRTRKLTSALATYVVGQPLGHGGGGDVFSASSQSDARLAVKILHPQHAASPKAQRFRNEVNFGTKIQHRNIVPVLDFGECEVGGKSTLFYVMPKFDGSLRDVMAQKRNPDELLDLFDGLLDALGAAHSRGVCHRDVKPENILYDASANRLLLTDFGIAHFGEDDLLTAVETRDGDRLANFQYAAPEQRIRGRAVDHRADLFAAGLILNELFTKELAHGAGYRRVAEAHPSYAYIDDVVDRLIQADAQRRPSAAADVRSQIAMLRTGPSLRKARDVHSKLSRIELKKQFFSSVEGVQCACDFVGNLFQTIEELAKSAQRLYSTLAVEYGISDDARYAVLRTKRLSMRLSWYYECTNSLRDARLTAYEYIGTSLLPSERNHFLLNGQPQERGSTEYIPDMDDYSNLAFRRGSRLLTSSELANELFEKFVGLIDEREDRDW